MFRKYIEKAVNKAIDRIGDGLFNQQYLNWKKSVFQQNSDLGFALSLTTRCNFDCSFCLRSNVDKGKTLIKDLPVPVFKTVLEEGKRVNFKYVSLTGGEPILHPDFPELLGLIGHFNYKFNVVSNAWLYKEYFPVLEKYRENLEIIQFSLGGATKEIHDKVRNKPGSFEKVIKAAGFYREKGFPVGISFTVDARNCHQLEEAAEFCSTAGVMALKFINMIPYGRSQSPICLDAGKKEEVLRRIHKIHEKYESIFLVQISHGFYSLPGRERRGRTTEITACPALDGRTFFIDPDGGMLFCCDINQECENKPLIQKTGFERSLNAVLDAATGTKKEFYRALLDNNREETGFCEFCNEHVAERF